MDKFNELYRSYEKDFISLQDFQPRLETLLGAFNHLTKEDEEFIKSTINQIELIIYTKPEQAYKDEVRKLIPQIRQYFNSKAKNLDE